MAATTERRRAWAAAAGLVAAAASAAAPAAAQGAQDSGGNRMERFGEVSARGALPRNCTDDRRWCAELARGRRGLWTLRIDEERPGPPGHPRTHLFIVPPEHWGADGHGGLSIWQTIVREGDGAVLVGLERSWTTGRRPGFFAFQRRLVLLRAAAEDGAIPVPVLEAPLSGHVEQPLCTSPRGGRDLPHGCGDLFRLFAEFTLGLSPGRPELAMAVTASTVHGLRPRSDGLPASLGPMGDPDPACSFTRSYRFDAAQGRYLPDAPLPACREYLEP
jgi:hypothetical protein